MSTITISDIIYRTESTSILSGFAIGKRGGNILSVCFVAVALEITH